MFKIEFHGPYVEFAKYIALIDAKALESATVDVFLNAGPLVSVHESCLKAAEPHAKARKKIEAIKAVRTVSGMDLKDAKDFVEKEFASYFPPIQGF